ncbi:MAG: hypothetical protein ABI559_13295 [Chloroflexota bacterium]
MRAILLLLALSTLAQTIACGGGDNDSQVSFSPVGTKTSSLTATPAPTDGSGATAPDPIDPTLDQELHEITNGNQAIDLAPGETFTFDPQALATDAGTTPVCANFQFDFSWQVQHPFPPDGVNFQWEIQRNGAPVKVAEGPNGEQSVGCDTVEAANKGDGPITVTVKYKIGGL